MSRIPYFGTAGLLQLIARLESHAEVAVIALIVAARVLFIIKQARS